MPERNNDVVIIGTGGFVRGVHVPAMVREPSTRIVALVDPSESAQAAVVEKLAALGAPAPALFTSLGCFLQAGVTADIALIASPHKFHAGQILAAMEAGLDVYVEKPMVISAAEAEAVVRARDATGRLVVVGFPGSLSPAMELARARIEDDAFGELTGITGLVHQDWYRLARGTWRVDPELSGGGFLFDTGSHTINNMVDLVRAPIEHLHAIQQRYGAPVDLDTTLSGRFANDVSFSINLLGNTYGCDGYILLVGTRQILQLGMWGDYLRVSNGRVREPFREIHRGTHHDSWKHFLAVWRGEQPNPCPAEVGLRFARFMDRVKACATVIP